MPLLPRSYNRYYEPFLGGASLFFALQPPEAVLSDVCVELIDTYRAIKREVMAVLNELEEFDPLDKAQYYAVRERRSTDRFRRAAEFIYLNRAGWNGLYRVNSRGEYNVPYGAPKTRNLLEPANALACSQALRRRCVGLRVCDFQEALTHCAEGDLVFLDPPYVTGHDNNGFVDYNERLFSWNDQERLAKIAHDLASKGVHVLVANANHDAVLSLYRGFGVERIERYSTLAGDMAARRPVSEVLMTSSQ